MTRPILFASSALFLCLALASPRTTAAQDMPHGGYGGAATNTETRLSAVEDQLRALTGKVEQMDYLSRRMDQALQRMQADFDQRLMKLETTPPTVIPPAPTPSAPPASTGHEMEDESGEAPPPQQPVTGTLGGVKMKGDKVTGGIINPKTPALPKTPEDYGLTAQELYDKAFGLLRQANYDDAEKAFKRFIDKHESDKLIDNAKYWYAETHYVRGNFNDAAIAFADAYQQNPKGTKAPDSLLKLAMSLGSLEKNKDACGALDALKSKYPNASSTIKVRADQERSKMKCK